MTFTIQIKDKEIHFRMFQDLKLFGIWIVSVSFLISEHLTLLTLIHQRQEVHLITNFRQNGLSMKKELMI